MMRAAVFGSEGMRRLQDAKEQWGGPPSIPTTTCTAPGLMFAHGALGVR